MRRNPEAEAQFFYVFQSTHPSGVRRTPPAARSARDGFQSTHPSGVRPGGGMMSSLVIQISIHAPQWGATARRPVVCSHRKFQSTHPSGVRPRTPTSARATAYFNPRTPVGCDVRRTDAGHAPDAISIHAPQWGATARMGIAFHNMEAPPVLKTDFIAKIHVHRSIHKFSNQKHQQTIHF